MSWKKLYFFCAETFIICFDSSASYIHNFEIRVNFGLFISNKNPQCFHRSILLLLLMRQDFQIPKEVQYNVLSMIPEKKNTVFAIQFCNFSSSQQTFCRYQFTQIDFLQLFHFPGQTMSLLCMEKEIVNPNHCDRSLDQSRMKH